MQRERFFDADAFSRFYRDNTMSEEIDVLNKDMFHGVIDVHRANNDDSLSRCDAVMTQAASVHPSGVQGVDWTQSSDRRSGDFDARDRRCRI
jgi:ABC-3C protein